MAETVDRSIDYAAIRKLTGADNQPEIPRDAVIIDAVLAAGARTAAHAADLAHIGAGAVKRHAYIRHLINQNDNCAA